MANALSRATTVTCTHLKAVSLGGQAKLRVAGQPVLVENSVKGGAISGCPNNQGGNTPCTSVSKVTATFAAKLRFGTDPVLLQPLAGETNGTVKPLLTSGGQTKLTAQ